MAPHTPETPADGTRDNPLCVCPFCGGELQITVQEYFTVTPEGQVAPMDDDPDRPFTLYCDNDCPEWKTAEQDHTAANGVPTKDEIQDVLVWIGQREH